jgi:hypothetical protein
VPASSVDKSFFESASEFGIAFNSPNAQGYQGVPWIIGEAYYNDANARQVVDVNIKQSGWTAAPIGTRPVL